MTPARTIVISPSGNFYGSEQVLWDYLYQTDKRFMVWVPSGSLLARKLSQKGATHSIRTWRPGNLPLLYFRIFLQLLGGVTHVYANEGGHNRWLLLLAKWFPGRKFVIHVRMLEDAQPGRWPGGIPQNVEVISISKTVAEVLPFVSHLVYDPYRFMERRAVAGFKGDGLVIGIIGRVTATKGLPRLLALVPYLQERVGLRYVFHLYGDVSNEEDRKLVEQLVRSGNVKLIGFKDSKEEIYGNIDCVLHLSVEEALGRIFFEALDHGKPFFGF